MRAVPRWSPSVWWFPVTYALHIGEEYGCGEGFPSWISRLADVQFTTPAFLWLNAVAMVLMIAGVTLAGRGRRRWIVAMLAVVVLINGSAHAIASVATWTYSPGLVTGLLLWVPLGAAVLRDASAKLTRADLRLGILAGVLVHAVVSGIVLVC